MADIPRAEPGLVVHFNFLWRAEFERGQQEARYPRPCAIVLSYRRGADGMLMVTLVPITHTAPGRDDVAIELPSGVKRHLGLDELRSWVVLDQVNETPWPGFDLHPNANGEYVYGFIPPNLFQRIRNRMIEVIKEGRLRRIQR